jgi:hypothetical protein
MSDDRKSPLDPVVSRFGEPEPKRTIPDADRTLTLPQSSLVPLTVKPGTTEATVPPEEIAITESTGPASVPDRA